MLNNILSKCVFHTSNWGHGIDWILSLTLRLCWDLQKSHNCNLTPLWWLCLTPVLLSGVSCRWFQLSVSFGNWVLCRSSWWPLCSLLLLGLQPFEFSPLHSDFSLSNSWTPLPFVHAPSTQLYPHLLGEVILCASPSLVPILPYLRPNMRTKSWMFVSSPNVCWSHHVKRMYKSRLSHKGSTFQPG